jgi:hypothetical protein
VLCETKPRLMERNSEWYHLGLSFHFVIDATRWSIAGTRKETDVKKLITGKYIRLWLFVFALSRCALAQVVPVSNLEELYSAVNNPANAGATLWNLLAHSHRSVWHTPPQRRPDRVPDGYVVDRCGR